MIIITDSNPVNKTEIHESTMIFKKKTNEEKIKLLFIVEDQLMNVIGITALGNHHLAATIVIINPAKQH